MLFLVIFLFYPYIKYKNDNLKDHTNQLNDINIMALVNHSYALIILDAGIKNNIATSITHVHICDKPIIKIVHHVVNITSTESELFTIRCGINQATNLLEILKITVITDSIHAAKLTFNYSVYFSQVHLAIISKELRKFFITNNDNLIKF